MKTLIASLSLAASLGALGADQLRHDVAVKDIRIEVQQTPDFSVSGPGNKRAERRQWLEIEAELVTKTNHPNGYIPELKVQWYAKVQDQFHIVGGKVGPKSKILTGTTTFKNIRVKDQRGGTAFVSAYIEPAQMEMLTGQDKAEKRMILAAAVILSGPGIAEGAWLRKAVGEDADKPWWDNPEYPKLDATILAKSKTPFAMLWTDRYPVEKEEE